MWTIASIVNLVQLQVDHTERPPLFAARLLWCGTSQGFVSDSWYLFYRPDALRDTCPTVSKPEHKHTPMLAGCHLTWSMTVLKCCVVGWQLRQLLSGHCKMSVFWHLVDNEVTSCLSLIMAALLNRAGHYIFAMWFLSIYLSFFPHLISAAADWMSTIFSHMAWP